MKILKLIPEIITLILIYTIFNRGIVHMNMAQHEITVMILLCMILLSIKSIVRGVKE